MNFNTSHSLHKSLIFNPPLENSINKTHLELADEKFEHSIERKKHEITDPILFVDTIFKKEDDDDDVNFKAEGFYTDDQQEIINKDLSANQDLLRRDIKFLFSEIEVLKKDGKRKDKVIEKLELKLKESQKKEVNLLNEEENIVTTNLEANSEPERYSEPESEQEPCPVNVNINGNENPESIKESEQEIDSEPDSEEEPDPVINGNENPESVEESEQEIDSEPDSEEEPNAVDKNTMMNTISFSQKGNLRKHEKSIHKLTDGENSTDDKKPTESSDGQKSSESMDDENSTDSQKSPGDQEFNNSALKTPVSNTSLNKKMGYGRPKQVSAEKEMKKSEQKDYSQFENSEVDKKTCMQCGKKFRSSNECQRHQRTHSGLKPFSCNYCENSFATKWNRDLHEKRIHNQATKSTNTEKLTEVKSSTEDDNSSKNKSTEDKKKHMTRIQPMMKIQLMMKMQSITKPQSQLRIKRNHQKSKKKLLMKKQVMIKNSM